MGCEPTRCDPDMVNTEMLPVLYSAYIIHGTSKPHVERSRTMPAGPDIFTLSTVIGIGTR